MKSKTSLLLSFGLGVLAVILMITWASARESQLLQLSNMKDVLVVTRDVPPNTILDEQVLSRKQVPATYVQPGAVTSVDAVRGRIAVVPHPTRRAGAEHLSRSRRPRRAGLRGAARAGSRTMGAGGGSGCRIAM